MRELRVTPIKNGTVIDHIPAGLALKVLKILGIGDAVTSTVTVAMHVPSQAMGWKDIVKVEDRELGAREIDKIALIAPAATVNVIRNYNVAEKRRVTLPDRAVGILRCANPNCISNVREPIESEFVVRSKNPLRVVCKYCDRELEEIVAHIV
jgi:aspartate carbamoyltransferase regulatory subunit